MLLTNFTFFNNMIGIDLPFGPTMNWQLVQRVLRLDPKIAGIRLEHHYDPECGISGNGKWMD